MNNHESKRTNVESAKPSLYLKSAAFFVFQAILFFGCASNKNQPENLNPPESLVRTNTDTDTDKQTIMLFPADQNNLSETAPSKQYKMELTQKMTNIVSNFLAEEQKKKKEELNMNTELTKYLTNFDKFNRFLDTTSPFFQDFFEPNFLKGLEPKKGRVLAETDKKDILTMKEGEMLFIGGDEIRVKGEAENFQINLKSQNKRSPKERTMHYVLLFNRGRRPYDIAISNFFADSTYATIPNETDHSRTPRVNVPWMWGRVLSAKIQVKYLTLTVCDISKGKYETISPIDLDALLQLSIQRQNIPANPSRSPKK